MAYLKVHYPNYFYANILSNVVGNESKTAAIIDEAKKSKLKILPLILMKAIGIIEQLNQIFIYP